MRVLKHLFLFTILTTIATTAAGQSVRAYLSKGLDAYQAKNYSSALAYFQVVVEEAGERPDALFYGGESARQMRSYQLAEKYLEAIPEEERVDDFALTDYYLAMTKKSLEKFDDAILLFERFAAGRHDVSEYREKAFAEIKNCEWAKEMMLKPVKVEMVHLSEFVNSIYSDYAPVVQGDTLYYTSTDRVKVDKSKKKKKKKIKPGRKKKKSKNVEEVLVTKIFSSVGGLVGEPIRQNSRASNSFTANLAFNQAGSRMYYTICEQLDAEKNIFKCELYYRDREAGRDWGRAIRLPEPINQPGSNSTQPAIGYDQALGQEVLYFVSDRPGGKGKMDLWVSAINSKGEFSAPVNLVEINTPEDDLTPFYDSATKTLFFSSDGYQNFGGYDVFSAAKGDTGWSTPVNLGYPINSSYDDVYYFVEKGTGRALLASNREGVICVSPDKDCNLHDIYQLTSTSEIVVSAFNENDFSMIYGASVKLDNLTTGKSEKFETPKEDYKIALPVNPQHAYRVEFSKEGYEPGTAEISPKDLADTNGETPKKYIFLKPWAQLVVRVLDAQNRLPVNGISLRVTDLKNGKNQTYVLKQGDLQFNIPVLNGHEYELAAIKTGFDAITERIAINSGQGGNITKDILLQSSFSGLPLTVYFDNNEPKEEQGQAKNFSTASYQQVYDGYISKKAEFIKQYADGLIGTDSEVAKMEATRFFDAEIQEGYYDLLKVSENLLFALQNGDKIELRIEGYASPLADGLYNQQLAERRIQTVYNHFETYKNGALKPYIDKGLTISKVPYGEKAADVSDDVKDRRSSVYSPKASKERRVTINGHRITNSAMSTSLK